MEHAINQGDVLTVDVSHQPGSFVHSVHSYIAHKLTPEREKELAAIVEQAVIDAVKAFVA